MELQMKGLQVNVESLGFWVYIQEMLIRQMWKKLILLRESAFELHYCSDKSKPYEAKHLVYVRSPQ